MPSQHDDGNARRSGTFQKVSERLGAGAGSPSVIDDERVNRPSHGDRTDGEPVRVKSMITDFVIGRGPHRDTGKAQPIADQCCERMGTGFSAGAGHGDQMSAVAAGPGGDTPKVITENCSSSASRFHFAGNDGGADL